jgi:integrase/recombinase XerC
MLFKWAATRGLYPNIADGVKGPRIRQDVHHRDALAEDDCKRILDSIDRSTEVGKRDYAIFLLCLTCGLRTIELERAKIEDLRTVAGRCVLAVWGKGRDEKDALVNVEAPVEEVIKDYLQVRPGARPGDPLFMSTSNRAKGRGITRQSLSRIIKGRLRAAGYDSPRITAHSLRHTAITEYIKTGGTMQGGQRFARHASMNTTMVYFHDEDAAKDHGGQRIYNAIMGKDSQPDLQAMLANLRPDQLQTVLAFITQLAA